MKLKYTNQMMGSIAFITGVAVGAVISALFAPKSGKQTRRDIAAAIKGVAGTSGNDQHADITGHHIEDMRTQIREKADHLSGVAAETVDLTKTTIKQKGPKSRQVPTES